MDLDSEDERDPEWLREKTATVRRSHYSPCLCLLSDSHISQTKALVYTRKYLFSVISCTQISGSGETVNFELCPPGNCFYVTSGGQHLTPATTWRDETAAAGSASYKNDEWLNPLSMSRQLCKNRRL